MRPVLVAATAVLLGLGTPAFAQQPGTVTLGAYGRYTRVDLDFNTDYGVGGGGRLGVFVLRNIAVELGAAYTTAKSKTAGVENTKFTPLYVGAAYHLPLFNKVIGIGTIGFVRDRTDPPGTGTTVYSDNGINAGGGLLYEVSPNLGIRGDLLGDAILTPYTSTPANKLRTGHIHAQIGVSYRFHSKPADGDADKDGVLDSMDICAGTAAGDAVDTHGCPIPKDADGDGVVDANDRCASTPAGTRVDASGCPMPTDADRDGVVDASDRCAGTPAGTRVDATGCPVPLDADRDGVLDSDDRCADTPAGTRVDPNGCPVPIDSDADGVMDNADTCPNTAAGVRVDPRGCAMVFATGATTLVLQGVVFAPGWAELTPTSKAILDSLAVSLVNAPGLNVEIAGYTDNTGAAATNTALSLARAGTVRAYLVSKGVPENRVTAKGYGPDSPVAPNTTADGRAKNRRVELKRTN